MMSVPIPTFLRLVSLIVATFGFGAIIKTKYGTGKPWLAKKTAGVTEQT